MNARDYDANLHERIASAIRRLGALEDILFSKGDAATATHDAFLLPYVGYVVEIEGVEVELPPGAVHAALLAAIDLEKKHLSVLRKNAR